MAGGGAPGRGVRVPGSPAPLLHRGQRPVLRAPHATRRARSRVRGPGLLGPRRPDGRVLRRLGRTRRRPAAVGCAGIELVPGAQEPAVELKRVFVDPSFRGHGIGAALLDDAESAARRLGASAVRLDTRHDLVEALGLYAKRGYVDVPAFNEDRYAQRLLALRL
ncbi:GNAT family N-acetyltransferase [Oerskovia sp. M15]